MRACTVALAGSKPFISATSGTLPPRRTAVQLSNQLYYDLFGRSYMYDEQILVGRGGSLFEVTYVDAWCRADA